MLLNKVYCVIVSFWNQNKEFTVEKMLSMHKSDRYPSMGSLAQRWLKGPPMGH